MRSFAKSRKKTLDSSGVETPTASPSTVSLSNVRETASTPPKGPNSSPKIKPMVIIVDELSNDREPSSPSRAPSATTVFTADIDAAVATSCESPTSSTAGSPSGSPTARELSDSQSRMRGFSKVSFRIKQLVSKEKRRFEENGFNLDLTYVTSRLIAFGYPAENLEGMYRNHYKDVYNFFEQRHPQRYRIYNLCTERSYDKGKFHNRVVEFRFDDHCPPPVAMFLPFCQDVDAWLHEHPENVAAIHCKAGKGRTGVMICAYLLYTGAWKTADGAMQFFGAARSLKAQGVTIPSQRRFIAYFGEMCRRARAFESDAASSDDDANSTSGKSGLEDELVDSDRNVTDESDECERERKLSAADFKRLWQDEMEGHGETTRRQMFQCQPTLPTTTHLKLASIKISGVYCQKKIDPRVRIECGGTKHRPPIVYHHFRLVSEARTPAFGHTRTAPTCASAQEVDRSSLDESEQPPEPGMPPSSAPSIARSTANMACVDLELACDQCVLWDEVKVTLRNRSGTKIGQLWFHTAFVKCDAATGATPSLALALQKHEIDKVVKDIKHNHRQFASSFAITLAFERATEEDVAAAEFAQTRTRLRVETTSGLAAFSTRFSSPGAVSPGKLHLAWSGGGDKASLSPSTADSANPPRAKRESGAQWPMKSTRVGDIEVFGAAGGGSGQEKVRREGKGGSTEDSADARPAETSSPLSSPSPSPPSPKSQLSRFFSSRTSRRKTTDG
ncbi:hypothetical protein PybrP1_009698 [[Pythium] brassicae (nom. inval.)]|nr:hypothetical protein PybrP1_009698 [[Pythium] brassicae (nom. inval.)]